MVLIRPSPARANPCLAPGTYHSDQHSLDCGQRVNKNDCDLDDRRIVRADGNACELNMSDGLIMKGSPPSSGRRTSAKQPAAPKNGASRAAASSSAASGKTSRKAVQKARPAAGKGKAGVRAAAATSRAIGPKSGKKATGRPATSASTKTQLTKATASKKPAPKSVAAKAPEIPAKARVAKATKPAPKDNIVKRAAEDVKSGVKMKGNTAPDKAADTEKYRADRQTAAATAAVKVKPQPAPAKVVLPENYKPTDAEPFMSPVQRHYFRLKLMSWKEEILQQTRETLQGMHEDTVQYADLADRATSETDRALELRARDRQRKLISKIDAALARIEDGTYGYCEETGEPIGLKRLDARPIATLSLEAQERHERRERVHRGD